MRVVNVFICLCLISAVGVAQSAYTYLALGDSYTIGESVDAQESWPIVLANSLTVSDKLIESTTVIAKTGWRTDQMLAAAQEEVDGEQFDLVSLLIGVNNEYQGRSPESFEPEFVKCLEYAIAKSKNGEKGVFVVSIPDYGFTPFGKENQEKITMRLNAYNSICEKVSKEKGVSFYYITDISRKGIDDRTLVAEDGLHPSGEQYQLWVNSFLENVRIQLK